MTVKRKALSGAMIAAALPVHHGLHVGPWNTGIPVGTTLTPSATITVTANDQLYENLDITGRVQLTTGLRAIFRRCRIRNTAALYTLQGDQSAAASAADGAVFEDCEIDGGADLNAAATVYAKFVTLRRCDVHGGTDVLKGLSGTVVEECWLHSPVRKTGGHHDITQITAGAGFRVSRSRLDGYDPVAGSNYNAVLQVGQLTGVVDGITFEDNYIDGGNYVLNYNDGAVATHGHPSNVSFRRNVFGPHRQYGVRSGFVYQSLPNATGVGGGVPFDGSNVLLATGAAA